MRGRQFLKTPADEREGGAIAWGGRLAAGRWARAQPDLRSQAGRSREQNSSAGACEKLTLNLPIRVIVAAPTRRLLQ
jgi:hypothetical protein